MNIEEKVFSYIEKYNMIDTGSHVLIGISGGADSVCLLFLLKEYAGKKNFSLTGIHINHGIRGEEADRDEEFTKKLCRMLEIPLTVCRCQVPETAAAEKISLEEAGRIVRRRAFGKERKRLGFSEESKEFRVALAHHENDNAETVLHNLIRGTGAGGLGGILPVQTGAQGIYIRPLLCVSRKEIRDFLDARKIPWMEDSSNQNIFYTRNRIRQILIPEMEKINPRAVEHIGVTAGYMRSIEEYLQEQADMLYGRYVEKKNGEYCVKKELGREKEIMQEYVLLKTLTRAAGRRKDISRVHVESVKNLLGKGTGAEVFLPYRLRARQIYGDLSIGKIKENSGMPLPLEFRIFSYENQQIPEKTYTKWFDYDKIKDSLKVRFRLPGDYFAINGQGGRKKLKDYFIDCKIPREEREKITLLAENAHILWAVGYRISEYYKITSQTKRVLEVHVKGVKEDE